MAADVFSFDFDASGSAAPIDTLRELAEQTLVQIGCRDTAGIARQVTTALGRATAAGGPCRLQIGVHDGVLTVVVSAGARELWRIHRPVS